MSEGINVTVEPTQKSLSSADVKSALAILTSALNGFAAFMPNNPSVKQVVVLVNEFASEEWMVNLIILVSSLINKGQTKDQIKKAVLGHVATSLVP